MSVGPLTFSRRHLHFLGSESTDVSQFPVVADGLGEEHEGAGPGLHAVVGEDGEHFKVRAHNHVLRQFDLWIKRNENSHIRLHRQNFKGFTSSVIINSGLYSGRNLQMKPRLFSTLLQLIAMLGLLVHLPLLRGAWSHHQHG